ncbi:MAG: VWA domain-containing protein, partial [Planctomycetes bacterium]|nr:VWA domain-containing protein [Planctomycetota bacterium]
MGPMSPWLRFLFGLGEGEVPDGARARFELTGMPHGGAWWLAACVVLAACVLIALLYRSERELGRLQSVALAALRLAALLVVVWMLLDPRILTVIEHKREASTLVLFDASASMGHADPIDPRDRKELEAATGRDLRQEWSRAELALGAIRQSSLLERLGEKNRVRSFTFDAVLVPVSELGASAFVPPGGPETRLGDALRGALAQAGSEPVAAVVLFTDGRTTGGERLEKAAAEAALRGVPVHAVALGTGRQPRNLAVAELSGPEVVQPGVPLRLQGRIEASGVREPVTVKLSRQPLRSGAKEDIETRKVEGRSLKWSSNVVFTDVLPRSGTYRYFLSVDLAPARRRDETDPADNQREVRVTASEERCRALLAASSPGRDFKFLGDFLTRDDGIQASCWLASADPRREQDGDVVIHELPQTPEALRSYDAV